MDKKEFINRIDAARDKYEDGYHEEAVKDLEAILNEHPSSLGTHFILGVYLVDLEKYEKATGIFSKITESRPDDEQASLGLFYSLFFSNRIKEACSEMERFLNETGSIDNEYANMYLYKYIKNSEGITFESGKKIMIKNCLNLVGKLPDPHLKYK